MRASTYKKNRWRIKGLLIITEERKVLVMIKGGSGSNDEINSNIRERDDKVWRRQELEEKDSLSTYKEWREKLGGGGGGGGGGQEKVYV